MKDDPQPARLSTSKTDANIERLQELIYSDHQLTICIMADELGWAKNRPDPFQWTIWTCERWVPNGSKTLDLRSERFIDLMCAKLTDHVLDWLESPDLLYEQSLSKMKRLVGEQNLDFAPWQCTCSHGPQHEAFLGLQINHHTGASIIHVFARLTANFFFCDFFVF